jgi:signal transduction histidine kinase
MKKMRVSEQVNILMVDDQPGKLLSYEAILGELGENLIRAGSGKQALELLLKNEVAVVLTDVNMPEMDGFELAKLIRQHPRFQETAIIFISGMHLTDLDRLKGYEIGAVDYISVPIIPELLRAKVRVFAELHRRTKQLALMNSELQRLSSRLIVTQDEERRRIARELHDGLGQELSAVKMILDGIVQKISTTVEQKTGMIDACSLVDNAIQQVRSVSHLLHPPLLDEVGLISALRWYLDGLTRRSGIETLLDVQPSDFPRLTPEKERAVFRIIQESVTNVYRHSGASKAWVTLLKQEKDVVISVRDDGKGIKQQVADFVPGSLGVGVAGMRQRVKEFGGELRLTNANPGTLVEVVIPSGVVEQDRAVTNFPLWFDGCGMIAYGGSPHRRVHLSHQLPDHKTEDPSWSWLVRSGGPQERSKQGD